MWKPGQSGNPAGRPRTGNSAAELARQQIDKHALFEKLGCLAAREGEYAKVDFAAQLNAIKILLSYGFGMPIAHTEIEGGEATRITVNYVTHNRLAIAGTSPGTATDNSRVQTIQRPGLRTPLWKDDACNRQIAAPGASGPSDGLVQSDVSPVG
jgi:hypothetical protein